MTKRERKYNSEKRTIVGHLFENGEWKLKKRKPHARNLYKRVMAVNYWINKQWQADLSRAISFGIRQWYSNLGFSIHKPPEQNK